MVKTSGHYFLAGITSFGIEDCEVSDVPGVYTYVPKFVDWIDSITNG
jgi:secreted trypsin-like serine protease